MLGGVGFPISPTERIGLENHQIFTDFKILKHCFELVEYAVAEVP